MDKKLFAFDLDGTAVNDRGELGDKTKAALRRARAAGHIVCFVTGRRDIDMYKMGRDACCADYLVLNNGGKIERTADGAVLRNILVDPADARRLVRFCLEKDYVLHVVSGMYWALNRLTPGGQSYIDELGTAPVAYHTLAQVRCDAVEGFMATDEGAEVGAFIDAQKLALEYVQSEPTCIDIMRAGVNKWGGVEALCAMLRLPHADVIAAGNYNNDIEMLQGAGVGVAVASALDSVKAAADLVTQADHNHDAMAEVIDRFVPA